MSYDYFLFDLAPNNQDVYGNDKIFEIVRILTIKFKEAFYNLGHVKQWTPKITKRVLEQSGFEISKIENIPFYFWFLSLHCLVLSKKNYEK